MAREQKSSSARSTKARKANDKPLCANLPRVVPPLAPDVTADPRRADAIVLGRSKWANGTVLHYCFFGGSSRYAVPEGAGRRGARGLRRSGRPSASASSSRRSRTAQRGRGPHRVLDGRRQLGLRGRPRGAAGPAERADDGLRLEPHDAPTAAAPRCTSSATCSAWSTSTRTRSPASSGTSRPCTTRSAQPPNSWDHATTFHNILEKLSPQQVQGSTWDPDSIMEYEFEPGLIDEPEQYDVNGLTPPGALSQGRQGLGREVVSADGGEADDAAAVRVGRRRSRRRPAGRLRHPAHRVTQVHDRDEGRLRHAARAVRDRSTASRATSPATTTAARTATPASTYKLFKGRTYIVRLRLYYPGQSGTTSLMLS